MAVAHTLTGAARLRHSVAAVWRDDLPDLVLGSGCVGCARPGRALCAECAEPLRGPVQRARPDPEPVGLPPTWAVTGYAGSTRAALVAHKEHAVGGVAGPLTRALGRALSAAVEGDGLPSRGEDGSPVWVSPVPSSRRAVRERGDDPLVRLARGGLRNARSTLGAETRLRWVPVLRVGRPTADQSGLGAARRTANLHRALVVPDRLAPAVVGRRVIVVDDVMTTGSTLAEAARALRWAGAEPVGAAVVAATRRLVRSFVEPERLGDST